MLVQTLFFNALEEALGRFLALDPDSGLFLKPLVGKVIAIRLEPPGWEFYLCPAERSVQFLERFEGRPDTLLSGSPLAFARLGLSQAPKAALFSGEIAIEGDMDTARAFQRLFENLTIDWEELLSHATGDVIAHRLGVFIRGGIAWGRDALETLRLNVAEYLQEETRNLPARAEADSFFQDIDRLRVDCDRLEARIARLRSHLDAVSKS